MSNDRDVVSVEKIIAAPPEAIFALVSDPHRHHELDGSGSVIDVKSADVPLALGVKFSMKMHRGFSYSTISTVTEYEKDRRIAWRSFPPSPFSFLLGGRTWRYELDPVEGGTRVRETWDIRTERITAPLRREADNARLSMEHTLEHIAALLA